MAYVLGMAENCPEEGAAVVISSATMANEINKFRTRAVLLVARADIRFLDIPRVRWQWHSPLASGSASRAMRPG